jgi:hypothetical protein
MARALTVQNAEINTASITIRTLQVEGRQVTMGVFRQLPVEDIIEPEGPHLKGVGWGHVNYDAASCIKRAIQRSSNSRPPPKIVRQRRSTLSARKPTKSVFDTSKRAFNTRWK